MNSPLASAVLGGPGLSAKAVAEARVESAARGCSVLEVLQERGGFTHSEIVDAVAARVGFHPMKPVDLTAVIPDFKLVPYSEASIRQIVCLKHPNRCLMLACCDPWSSSLRLWGEEAVRADFEWAVIHPSDLAALLSAQEASLTAVESLSPGDQDGLDRKSAAEDISLARIGGDSSPVVRFVNSTLYDALKSGASDIHFEISPSGLNVKYRLDGVLVPAGTPRMQGTAEQVISRIKVMAELDIAEQRIPQDGRFRVSITGREVDFRVSIMPSIHGEDAVLRILDKQYLVRAGTKLDVDVLGFDTASRIVLRRLAREPYGMLLVTGPTGSGKTTTLYAAINEINDGNDKIVTIEDPVEYELQGVLQIPVNEKKGLTFARGLRSILRHDPDKILVGEIRDPETAEIAVQAALTGHLVFTTVHANNVFDVLGRFVHMKVDPYSFVSALNGIMAQRLVRMICPHCTREIRPEPELLAESGLCAADVDGFMFHSGAGCGECRGTGYKGRKAISEVLNLNEEIRELIVARSPYRELRAAAKKGGTVFLREQAIELVRRGETTLEEINRVTLVA